MSDYGRLDAAALDRHITRVPDPPDEAQAQYECFNEDDECCSKWSVDVFDDGGVWVPCEEEDTKCPRCGGDGEQTDAPLTRDQAEEAAIDEAADRQREKEWDV